MRQGGRNWWSVAVGLSIAGGIWWQASIWRQSQVLGQGQALADKPGAPASFETPVVGNGSPAPLRPDAPPAPLEPFAEPSRPSAANSATAPVPLVGPTVDQPATADPQETPPRESPPPLSPEALEEILRLRRMVLGNAPTLGAIPGRPGFASEDQFREALRKLGGVDANDPRGVPAREVEVRPDSNEAPPRLRPEPSLDPRDSPSSEEGEYAEVVLSLRETCRMLDARASELEIQRRFHEADRLRKLTRKMRREARDLERESLARAAAVPQY